MVCWWTPRKIHGNWCRQADLAVKITPCALCPMPYAPCLMPCALRPMPHAPHLNLFFWNNPPTLLCRGMGVIDYFCPSRIKCMLWWWTLNKIHGTWCRQTHLAVITPCALRPMPYALRLTPYALRPTPYALHTYTHIIYTVSLNAVSAMPPMRRKMM